MRHGAEPVGLKERHSMCTRPSDWMLAEKLRQFYLKLLEGLRNEGRVFTVRAWVCEVSG